MLRDTTEQSDHSEGAETSDRDLRHGRAAAVRARGRWAAAPKTTREAFGRVAERRLDADAHSPRQVNVRSGRLTTNASKIRIPIANSSQKSRRSRTTPGDHLQGSCVLRSLNSSAWSRSPRSNSARDRRRSIHHAVFQVASGLSGNAKSKDSARVVIASPMTRCSGRVRMTPYRDARAARRRCWCE